MAGLNSVEAGILLATASTHLSDAGRLRLRSGLQNGANWADIVESALVHGTAGLLCHHLLQDAGDLLPPDLQSVASEFLASQQRRNASAIQQLFQILGALSNAGIAAMPFKGPVLAQAAYGGVHLRGFRDLDILIREQDIEPTMAVLASLGHRSRTSGLRKRRLLSFYRDTGQDICFAEELTPVEPHWTFAPRSFVAEFHTVDVFQRSSPLLLAERSIQTPSAEDAFILLGLHRSKERWKRLVWISDVSEFERSHPSLDWDIVLGRARSSGLLRMVLLGCALANRMLDSSIPDVVRQAIDADRTCQALVAQITESKFAPQHIETSFQIKRFNWMIHDQFSNRMRYIFRDRASVGLEIYHLVDLPDWLAWAYPLVRGFYSIAKRPFKSKA
ncbi:hypothetical protein DC522_23080 [Microvirga sp. KLBC 81]|nr:hypothetical protein DC522_23080 [Microvirga sp. KLBC 81]